MFGVMYLQGGPPADRYKWGEITPVNVLPEPCAFFFGGGLKNPSLHCNDVYMSFLWLKKGGGAKIFVQRIPLRPMFWSFGGVFVHRGSEAKGRVVCFQMMFAPQKNAPDLLTFFLDGENVTLSMFVGDLQLGDEKVTN